jgi:maleamate amidohydrolase
MLNDFLQSWAPASKQRLIQSINSLIGTMRDYERPVIWVRQEFEPDLRDAFPEMRAKAIRITIRGTPGCRIDSDLEVGSSCAT